MIKSVEKAISILKAFTFERPELSVTELSQELALHKSTVSRLLSTLEGGGLVEQNPETGKYHLGAALLVAKERLSRNEKSRKEKL